MDNEQTLTRPRVVTHSSCATNNPTQSQPVVSLRRHLVRPVIHDDSQQLIIHCCFSESKLKKQQPVVFLFVFSSAHWPGCVSTVHWAVQLQFNKPYGCQITLTSKYYKCPELDSCFRDSSKYQPRIIGQSDILSGLESYISHWLLTLHCKPGRVMTCMGGGGTNDHIVTPSLTHGAGDSGNNYPCEIIRHQLSLSSLDENQWAGARLRPQLRFVR